jgi:hypothetical protein
MTIDKIKNGVLVKTSKMAEQEKLMKRRKLAKNIQSVYDNSAIQKGPRIMDLELEETGGFVEPNQRSFVYPRLFVVNNDGTAKELLSRS